MAETHIVAQGTRRPPTALCGARPTSWFTMDHDGKLNAPDNAEVCADCARIFSDRRAAIEARNAPQTVTPKRAPEPRPRTASVRRTVASLNELPARQPSPAAIDGTTGSQGDDSQGGDNQGG